MSIQFLKQALISLLCLCWLPAHAVAFDLIDLDLNLTLSEPEFSHDYATLQRANSGFTLFNPDELTVNVKSLLLPALGLQAGEAVQPGFVLYDGTLFLEVEASDPQGGRADLRTTYRMDVDGRMLGRTQIRDLFVRQGRYDEGRARVRARAARLADARIMRFVENESEAGGRWVRAVRAVSGRANADVRFMPRAAPDGVLGHYGYDTKADGSSYVWAVLDKNSRYAVGLNVDDDGDGIFNVDDNCRSVANPDQADFDGNGIGDACDDDIDGDGILNENDLCPTTGLSSVALSAVVDEEGCAIADRCPCEAEVDWNNHGEYVQCVAEESIVYFDAGLYSEKERGALVSTAARSQCGK